MYSDEHNNINRRGGSEDGEGGGVRRRPPTAAPYTQSAYAASSSNHGSSYGTNEEDALLHSHNEEGYPVLQSYRQRRRLNNYPGAPWYRQPQKLILAATLAWVGGVMYLASLAHAILRTHKETSNNMMGISSMVENNEDFKEWLQSQGMLQMKQKKFGAAASTGGSKSEDFQNWLESQGNKYGSASDVQNDADFQAWAEAQANKYGSSGEKDENYQQWLESQANKYGSTWENNENYRQWLEEQAANKYGASAETNEDFQQWFQSQKSKNKYGAVNSAQNSASDSDAWQDWLAYVGTENSYGSTTGGNGNNKGTTKSKSNVNVRFGNSDANYQDWLEYQSKNKQVQYNANGMYGKGNPESSSRAMGDATQAGITSDKQVHQPSVAAASDSSISTIDWPLQGLPHASCTSSSGCSPSTNVTVLIVYGPEYHTHISEMAWNVATGVHTAFESHIRHHPNSPLHGHIVFGHTSNVTFLDVMDADAVIIGSPVYNGNVHPDVQNVSKGLK